MTQKPTSPHEHDGIDRRGFLECMAWAGTGMIWTLSGGIARSQTLGHPAHNHGAFNFVQISDSHVGFNKDANPDVTATLQAAVARINALPDRPAFLIHTGDITHLSNPAEFDTADSILQTVNTGARYYVPGEHDVLGMDNKLYLGRYGRNAGGDGWFSFDHSGVHFVGLVNVMNLKPGGLGNLGEEQLAWLARDLKGRRASMPIVVFAHVPLWTIYPEWGWGTDDGARALALLRRFGSVTVLNGHIHQTMQKVEGHVTFHTACSTAFPQPKPGAAPSPGPMKVPAEQLRAMLGLTSVRYLTGKQPLGIVDISLDDGAAPLTGAIRIDNFSFAPRAASVAAGAQVTWVNEDDLPHNVVCVDKSFASPALDTGEKFARRFDTPGEYDYYCSFHPKMTGKLVVKPA